MTKEQSRPAILKIIGQIVPDGDLNNHKGDIPLREQMGPDSVDLLDIIVEPRKRCGVEVREDDYVQLAALDSSIAYLEPRAKQL
jgi:acyl carrier protein